MMSRNVTNNEQTRYVGKNLLPTAFAMSRFEQVEAILSLEKSSSNAGIRGDAMWTKESQFSLTLEEIWSQIEQKQARAAREGAREVVWRSLTICATRKCAQIVRLRQTTREVDER